MSFLLLHNNQNIFMLSGRTRNYSLRTLYPRRPEQEREVRGKLLPTIAETRDLQKTQAKELGINIKRFQNLVQQKTDNGEDIARAAFFVLRSFSEVDNNFREVFADLHDKLRPFLFLADPDTSLKYRLKEGVSLKKALKTVEKTNAEWLQVRDKKIAELQGLVALTEEGGRLEAARLSTECQRLKQQCERLRKMANVEYVKSLQRKVQDLKETISTQEEDYRVLAKKNEESSLEIEQLRREVGELQVGKAQLQEKVHDLSVVREKTELYLLRTKDRFDELHNSMGGLKEVIAKVEHENETLVAERMQLVNRAAVAFEDLTPRPKYGDFFLIDRNTHLNPTSQIVQALLEAQEGPKEVIFQRYFQAKKNRKLMEVQAIRDKTVKEIQSARAEMAKIK